MKTPIQIAQAAAIGVGLEENTVKGAKFTTELNTALQDQNISFLGESEDNAKLSAWINTAENTLVRSVSSRGWVRKPAMATLAGWYCAAIRLSDRTPSGNSSVRKDTENSEGRSSLPLVAELRRKYYEANDLLADIIRTRYISVKAKLTVVAATITFDEYQLLEVGQVILIGADSYTVLSETTTGLVYTLDVAPGSSETQGIYTHTFNATYNYGLTVAYNFGNIYTMR